MTTYFKYLFVLLALFLQDFTAAQNTVDSLQKLLPAAKADTSKVNLLNDIAWELKASNPDTANLFLDQAIRLSQQLSFRKGEAQAYNFKGVIADINSRYPEARTNFEKALAIRLKLGDRKGVASIYSNLGNVMRSEGDLVGAMKSYQQALQMAEELRDTSRVARTYYSMAVLYETMGSYTEALDYIYKNLELTEAQGDLESAARSYNVIGNIKSELESFDEAMRNYRKALELHRRDEDEWGQASALQNIGNALDNLGEKTDKAGSPAEGLALYQDALDHYRQSLALRLKLEDVEGESSCYNNMGVCFKHLKQYETALEYFQKSLAIRQSLNDKRGIAEVFNGIGDIKRRQQKYREALDLTQRYYAIAKEIQDQKYIQMALLDLSRIYEATGDYKKAFEYRKSFDEYRYERINEKRLHDQESREALYGDHLKFNKQNQEIALQQAQLQQATIRLYSLVGAALGLCLLAFLLYNRNRIKTRANIALAEKNEQIENEKRRSDDLLLNILPEETAKELKDTGVAKTRYYESVTVLFTDFKSFTEIAERCTPEALVAELDTCFKAFDTIIERHGIEKIKTIGDAYMCAGGLPETVPDHALRTVAAALEMQAFMVTRSIERKRTGLLAFDMRVGIHSGSVVAGVVGSRKFAYDIWGDTVNLAARMETAGEPGRVNISQATYALVRDQYTCTSRGRIAVKNKGEVEMYFVE